MTMPCALTTPNAVSIRRPGSQPSPTIVRPSDALLVQPRTHHVRARLPCRTEVQTLWFLVAGFTAAFSAHTAPFPFLLERFAPLEICAEHDRRC